MNPTLTPRYRRFVNEVSHRTYVPDEGKAAHYVRATLETLAEYLTPECASQISAYLPRELRPYFEKAKHQPNLFSLMHFFVRVSARENDSFLSGIFHARSVLEVLAEFIPAPELVEIRSLLPKQLGGIFQDEKLPFNRHGAEVASIEKTNRLLGI